jgi:hypothetical protein
MISVVISAPIIPEGARQALLMESHADIQPLLIIE